MSANFGVGPDVSFVVAVSGVGRAGGERLELGDLVGLDYGRKER